MTTPTLNNQQQVFLTRFMKPFNVQSTSPIYWDMVLKVIQNQLLNPQVVISTNATILLESIVQSIAYAQIDDIMEDVLTSKITSTKSTSYNKTKEFTMTKCHNLIVNALTSTPYAPSRSDLAQITGLRLSAVCGRVKELIDQGMVQVIGTKWDDSSKRDVQTLEVTI